MEEQSQQEIRELTSEIRAADYQYSAPKRGSVASVGTPVGTTPKIDPDADLDIDSTDISKMPLWVKLTFGAPQFSIFSIYMLISVHCTIYYEKLGAKVRRSAHISLLCVVCLAIVGPGPLAFFLASSSVCKLANLGSLLRL